MAENKGRNLYRAGGLDMQSYLIYHKIPRTFALNFSKNY